MRTSGCVRRPVLLYFRCCAHFEEFLHVLLGDIEGLTHVFVGDIAGGVDTKAEGGIYDISNADRLGYGELQLMQWVSHRTRPVLWTRSQN